MSALDLIIHGKTYRIACGDGEEERLRRIATEFDERVKNLLKNMGKADVKLSEAHLLVLTALVMADELEDARSQVAKLQGERESDAAHANTNKPSNSATPGNSQFEERVSQALTEVASRLEMLAARLDQG